MFPIKILIVEDEIIVAERIALRLIELGYEICGKITSGEEALISIQKMQPDLILMDIVLDGVLDGIQTAEKIMEQYKIPIIYLTALDDRKTMLRAGKTNPANYLKKPYRINDIRVAIDFAILNYAIANDEENQTFLVQDSFFVKKKEFYEKISIQDVLWICPIPLCRNHSIVEFLI